MDLAKEPMVDDRPLAPNRGGAKDKDGVDVPDRCDPATEPLRTTAGPGEPDGALVNARVDCVGDDIGDGFSVAS